MSKQAGFTFVVFFSVLMLAVVSSASVAQSDTSPVAQDGPYKVGIQTMDITDAARDDRVLQAFIWYPALVSEDAPEPYPPDMSGAPYPLVLVSHGYGAKPEESVPLYINHLVSQGFVVAGANHQDGGSLSHAHLVASLIERPPDLVLLLNHLTDLSNDPLVGMMDTGNVGIIGESFGGYTAIAVSGARYDLRHFADWCSAGPEDGYLRICMWRPLWADGSTFRQLESESEDGLVPVITDERIRAILPIVPCFGRLFGERGLETVTVPVLVIGTNTDDVCPYETDAAYFFEHVGSSDRYLVTFEGRSHGTIFLQADAIQHYAAAFFGLYLQGKTEYAQYLTPASAAAYSNATLEAQIEAE